MSRFTPFVMICVLMTVSAYADGTHPQGIRLDGTIGTAGKLELPGPDYAIRAEYGKQAGANLFHSFEQFNIHSGESATFSGPDSVKNIISRVTGGSASWIDGKLASTIPNADMYFLNPFGVMFGSNASLDLGGSVHVSTADYLKMGDNERFYAVPRQNEILSVAAPMAFGFLSDNIGSISAEGSFLSVPTGKTASFIGGAILFHNNTLIAQEGRVNLASAASAGEIRFSDAGIDMNGIEKQGNIIITRDTDFRKIAGTDYSWADITAAGINIGGEVFIRAERFEIRGGAIITNIFGDGNGKEINISVTEDMVLDGAGITLGGNISGRTFGSGNAGHISIKARSLTLDNHAEIAAETYGTGNGGSVFLNTSDLTMDEQSIISARTFGNGNSGDIRLNVSKLTLSSGAEISTETIGSGHSGSISISAKDSVRISGLKDKHIGGIYANTYRDGNGGNILINTPCLSIDQGGEISSEAGGTGDAGEILLNLTQLALTDRGAISTDTFGTGCGGSIAIFAEDYVRISGSLTGLYADSEGGGEGGTIGIKTPVLEINDGGVISASTKGDHNAGEIALNVNHLSITEGAEILAASSGAGQGGNVSITADSVNISGTDTEGYKSGIYASTLSDTGAAGNIMISASDIRIGKDGVISAFSIGNGKAGTIRLNTETLSLTDGGEISTEIMGQGDGNDITIVAENSVNISDSPGGIYTSTYGRGNSGNITLSAPYIRIDKQGDISAATSGDGNAGEIRLTADTLILNEKANITASSYGAGDGNNIVLKTSDLIMENNSYIFAFSTDTGRAGNIGMEAHDVRMNNSAITTGSFNADGGDISFRIGSRLYLSGSQITTSVKGGTGSGGNITIDPQFVILNNSKILAQAYGGNGGNIRITADNFIRSSRSLVDASSKLGIDGSVEIDSPDENLSSILTVLPTSFSDTERWAITPCDERTDQPRSRFFIRRYFIPPELYEP